MNLERLPADSIDLVVECASRRKAAVVIAYYRQVAPDEVLGAQSGYATKPVNLIALTKGVVRRVSTPLNQLLVPDKALIFRITHRDNVAHLLEHGVHCRNSPVVNPNFVEIGHPEIIGRRAIKAVGVSPYGTLADYVPFYFTPCSPMLYNIVTGWKGLRRRDRAEIVILLTSLDTLEQHDLPYVVADRNAALDFALLAPCRELVPGLSWRDWQNRDFRHDADNPAKVERYQAEALVHDHLPSGALRAIITYDEPTRIAVALLAADTAASPPVRMIPSWYV
ncbi:MAG: DUF4433 domain-containing protein [Gemmatimonadales bacterium]